MESTIYYFSSTGNSLHVAKIIQKELQGRLLPMAGNTGTSCSSEVIGFVFPTYYWGIPHIVGKFLSKLKIEHPHPYIFAVTTCGLSSGGALGMVKALLDKHHLNLNYGKKIRSVSNYIIEYNINPDRTEDKLQKAAACANQAARDIMERKNNHVRKPFLLEIQFYKAYQKRRNQDHLFFADEHCIGCGMCERVCPVHNISMENGKPKFHHHCEHCIACIHWCPEKALQFQSKTAGRNRYQNPFVSANELNRQLAESEPG